MKKIIRLPAMLVLLCVAVLATGYGLLQSPLAAQWLAYWLNRHSGWHLNLASLDYRLTQPDKLVLHQVQLTMPPMTDHPASNKPQLTEPQLQAQQIVIHFSLGGVTAISIEQGRLNLTSNGLPQIINTSPLQFHNLTISQSVPWGKWQLAEASGNISPSQGATPLSFQLSAPHFTFNNWQANNIKLQGEYSADGVNFTHIKAQLAGGSLTGSAQQQTADHWLISDLQLNQVHGQTDRSLKQLADSIQQFSALSLPVIQLQRFSVHNAQLEGSDWAASDLHINIRNLTLQQGHRHIEQGDFSLNASDLLLAGEHFIQPKIAAKFTADDVILHSVTSQWRKGKVQASGRYQPQQHALTLDNLDLSRPEYSLPPQWRQLLQRPLPRWLDKINVLNLRIWQGLIIDTDPLLPFQLTAFNGEADQLQLANNQQWGFWRGNLHARALQATFNGVDLHQPVLDLHADTSVISSLLQTRLTSGALSASLSLCQCPERNFTLRLTAKQLAASVLPQWGWPGQLAATSQRGSTNQPLHQTQLQLEGQLRHLRLLPASLNGTLQISSDKGQSTEHILNNGTILQAAPR